MTPTKSDPPIRTGARINMPVENPGRELAPCGTRAAYRRHLRRYEQPCPACCEAAAEYMRNRRAARKARTAETTPGGNA